MANLWKRFTAAWRGVPSRQLRRSSRRALRFDALEAREVMSTTPIISEFLASNQGGLTDFQGDSGDWIEIYNPTSSPINLLNYSLTDNANDLNQWQFPDVTIGPNQFLVVFADSKNIKTGSELHTNFSISNDGEYLALVDPLGDIVSEYAPTFPPQVGNVSYGVKMDATTLIGPTATANYFIPTNNTLGTTWTNPAFTPTGWSTGQTGIGFGILQPGFNVQYIKANRTIDNLDIANQIINDPSLQQQVTYTTAQTINYETGGRYGGGVAFPTQTLGSDFNWFLIKATGKITIPTSGSWSFGVNSDDGFGLTLEKDGVVFTSQFFGLRGSSDTIATFNLPSAGDWNVTLVTFENEGGASAEFFARQGSFSTWSTSFRLVGDTANGGLAVKSAPGAGGSVSVNTDTTGPMLNQNATAYIRIPFNVTNPADFDELHLDMQYDDGFVVYLNGTPVASRNAPASPSWNSPATQDRTITQAVTAERIDLSNFLNLLQTGNNVLAIHGMNSSASDPSFLIAPRLEASSFFFTQPRFFETPTPGSVNVNPSLGIVEKVVASAAAGFYTTAMNVTLSTPTPGATIRYTTNGSEPTLTNGTVYTGPIAISTTTALRARAFLTDYISRPAATWTYLYLDDVIRQSPSDDVTGGYPDTGVAPSGWPTTWGNNVVDYGMDQTIVNSVGATQMKSALLAIPTMTITTDLANLFDPSTGIYANPGNDGRDWERSASLEMINPDGTPGFQVGAGIRMRGGFSRSTDNPKHAFRIFFRSEYGDNELDYPIFGNQPGAATSFQKFDLRTAQNYSWSFGGDGSMTMIQDGFEREQQLAMGEISTHSRWVHLYLNGQYWGLFQIEERPEANFGASYLGGDPDNFDTVKSQSGGSVYATDGTIDAYNALYTAVTTQDVSNNTVYYRMQGKNALGLDDPSIPNAEVLLDVDNLITYMIGIFHGGDLDAPISAFMGNNGINNFYAVRDRTGRLGWQFVRHDAEHTLLNVNENRMGPFNVNDQGRFNPQTLHQVLMANADYRIRFADLVQKFLTNNGPLSVSGMQAIYNKQVAELNTAIYAESARWGDSKRPTSPLTRSNWLSAVSNQRDNFLVNRNPVFLNQLRANGLLPTLNAPTFLVNGVAQQTGSVAPGSKLRFGATGPVYYMLDGTDPRLPGGGISPSALVYDATLASTTLFATGSSWKYFDQGTDLGTAWRASAFNDAAWATGAGEFGYGDGDETTVVSFGPNASAKYITTYFRKSFTVADPTLYSGLTLRIKRDDGAVVYVNGQFAGRSNMPTSVGFSTLATSDVSGTDENTYFDVPIDPALLVAGNNVIAIEIHQSSAVSPDLSFDAELIATGPTSPPITLSGPTLIGARALSGTTWSPFNLATYNATVAATVGNLAITELHYNPVDPALGLSPPFNDAQNYEFVELRNIGAQTINLTGVRFTTGITFDFSTGSVPFLAPGASVLVVSNLQAFQARYGNLLPVAGAYSGNLSNGGEQIVLVDAANNTIHDFIFDDLAPWPTTPDGGGPSLTVVNVAGNYSSPANWRPSFVNNGTPGYDEDTATVPSAPTGLQSNLTGYTATSTPPVPIVANLTWAAAAGATSYRIERKTGVGGTYAEIGISSGTNYADSGLAAGTTYLYRIRGVNPVGNGAYSAEITVTTQPVPPAPVSPQILGTTATTISLRWTDNVGTSADGYRIFRSADGGAFEAVASLSPDPDNPPSTYDWQDTNLTPGTIYAYQISAYNVSGFSTAATITATTLLDAPNLIFAQRMGNSATLYFSAVPGATSYSIYRGTSPGSQTLYVTGVANSPYTDNALQTGVTYYYYVTAINANAVPASNESAPSNVLTPTTATGATFQWSGAGGNNNWSTGANWVGGVAPLGNLNETLVFPNGASRLTNVNDLPNGNNAFAGIIVSGAGYNLSFQNNLAIGATGLAINTASTFIISAATPSVGLYLTANSPIFAASGATLTINSDIVNLGNTFVVSGAGSFNFPGDITGPGGMTLSSTGSVSISGANDYSGATQINSGTISVASNTALGVGSAVTVTAGATVNVQNILVSGVGLMGSYYNVSSPSGTNFASLSALNSHISTLTPALVSLSSIAGLNNTFDFGGDGSAFPAPYNSGATNFEAVYTGNFTAPTTGLYTFVTGSDDGSMIFIDGQTVVNNNFSQGVTERSGTVNLTAGPHSIVIAYYQGGGGYGFYANVQVPGGAMQRISNSLLSSVTVNEFQVGSLAGGGSINLGNNNITIGNAGTGSTSFSGSITGSGNVIKTGASTQALTGNSTYTGKTTISQGALTAGVSNALGSSTGGGIIVESGGSLQLAAGVALGANKSVTVSGNGVAGGGAIRALSGSTSIAGAVTLGTASTISSDAGTLTISGNISSAYNLTVGGAGNTTITGVISSGLPGLVVGQSNNVYDFGAAANPNPAFGSDIDLTTTMANKTGGDGAVIQTTAKTWATNNTWFYRGQIYFPNNNGNGTGTITFGENVDDGTFLRIDGTTVLNDTTWNVPVSVAVTRSTGWHEIDLRFSNGGGGAGAVAGTGWTSTKGFGYFLGSTTSTDGGTFVPLTDPGNGSFLRTAGANINLTKTGTGTLTLSATNSFLGSTIVQQGTLLSAADGSLSPTGTNVTVAAAGTFGGGNVNNIPASISGKLAPGTATNPAQITLGSLAFAAGSSFEVNLLGSVAGSDYDVAVSSGAVNLNGATLNVITTGYTPAWGTTFTILVNNSGSAITGTFAGLAEGGVVTSGTNKFRISYVGGANGRSVVLTTITTTTGLVSNLNPSNQGQSVTFTATVSPSPGTTGTVTFFDNGVAMPGGSNRPLSGGVATVSISTLSAGSHSITAVYNGATNYGSSTSSALNQTVNSTNVSTSTSLVSNTNPSTQGASVTFTATISPSPGTVGTVTFLNNGVPLSGGSNIAVSGGVAQFSTTSLPAGSNSITAVYSGGTGFNGSTSNAVSQVVNKVTTTNLVSNVNPSNQGASVTFTATIPQVAGNVGTVSFFDNGVAIPGGSNVSVASGVAQFTTSTLSAGTHPITAVYSGGPGFAGSTSSVVSQVVNALTTTSLASSNNPSIIGSSVTFTATIPQVSGNVGTVTFRANGVTISGGANIPVINGVAQFSTSSLAAGSNSIVAIYSGGAGFAGSVSSPLAQVVNLPAPATLVSTVVNGGTPQLQGLPIAYVNQRSMVRSIRLTFDKPVTLTAGAVAIAVHANPLVPSPTLPGIVTLLNSTGGTGLDTIWDVTFGGANVTGGSIGDGEYDLTVDPTKVIDTHGQQMASAPALFTFYRLLGDSDGNRNVNNIDIINVRRQLATTQASPSYLWLFDSDWNGTISNLDIIAFRRNAGRTI
jgi:autotransporter-associated beta strand protein